MADDMYDADNTTTVNPAALAENIRETPAPYDDDSITDDQGHRVKFSNTRERNRSGMLGQAAGQSTMDGRITTSVGAKRAKAAGMRARQKESRQRRKAARRNHKKAVRARNDARRIPLSTRSHKQKVLSTWSKPFFVVGDTAVMGSQLYRIGVPPVLAILLGISMAMSTVAVGTMAGRALALSWQRMSRGDPPENCEPVMLPFYDSENASREFYQWLVLGGATTGALLVAVTLLGVGGGDSAALAFGFGLLAALTFGGAAGAEAYGTNAAADYLEQCEEDYASSKNELEEFEDLADDTASATELADVLLVAAENGAAAAATTVEQIADRTPDNPGIFTYELDGKTAEIEPIIPRKLQPMQEWDEHESTETSTTPDPTDAPVIVLPTSPEANASAPNGARPT